MKAHTNDFKDEIKKFGREIDSKITYTIDGTTTELGKEELNSVTPHYESNILKSTMKQLDIDSNVEIPVGTVINYQFGLLVNGSYEYINYGNYVVYKSEKQEDTNSWKITCYDKMLYAMKPYENLSITYPITIRNYIGAICTKLGLTFANSSDNFANYNREIASEVYLDGDGNTLGYTYRDVLDELAQATASVICINENDELEVRYPQNAGEYETKEGTSLSIENVDDGSDLVFDLNGNTVQDGTPTPNSPVEVQTVTGKQDIETCKTNLFQWNIDDIKKNNPTMTWVDNVGTTTTGLSITLNEDGSITANGTPNGNTNVYVSRPGIAYRHRTLNAGTYYATSHETTGSNSTWKMQLNDGTTSYNIFGSGGNKEATFTITEAKEISFYIVVYSGKNPDGAKFYPMIAKTSSVDYEKYNGTSYEINLGKNLWGGVSFEKTSANVKYTTNPDGSIICDGTSSGTGGISLAATDVANNKLYKVLPPGTYTLSSPDIDMNNVRVQAIKIVGTTVSQLGSDVTVSNSSRTFTINEFTNVYVRISINAIGVVINKRIRVLLEKGSQATSYSAYKTPIELCKIGDYKDGIYKENGKWYLYKTIGKYILDGTNNKFESKHSTITSATKGFYKVSLPNKNTSFSSGATNTAYTDYFALVSGTASNAFNNNTSGMWWQNTGETVYFILEQTSLTDANNWLKSNNTSVYYILNVPTTTEITDTELINQLESVRLLQGLNNVAITSGDLSTPIKMTYLKYFDTIDEEYLKDVNVNFGEKYGPINSIVLSRASESDSVYLRDEESVTTNGLCEIKIKDNQIMNLNNRADYLPDILEKLDGLEYYYNDFSSTGVCYYDVYDKYNVSIDGNIYNCIMFNDEINVTQGLEENIHTELAEESETDYTHASKDDRQRNQAYIIAKKNDAEIQALASKVVDVSDTVSGIGSITLENAYEGILHRLEISGSISSLMPRTNLTPSNTLTPVGIYLVVDETRYLLDIDYLNYTNTDEHDTFIYEDGNCWIERANGTIEERQDIVIYVEKDSEISIEPFTDGHLYCEYLLDNKYTSTFANQVEVSSELNLLADTLEAKVSQVADEDGNVTSASIILAVNNDSSQATIDANKISLQGKEINLTSDNININSENFKVDKNGNLVCNNANINNGNINIESDYTTSKFHLSLIGHDIYTDIYPYRYTFIDNDNNTSFRIQQTFHVDDLVNDVMLNIINAIGEETRILGRYIETPILYQTSQEEKKKDFEKLENALNIIKDIDIYKYRLKNQNENSKKHIGFVIGDNYKYSQDVTSNDNNSVDIYSFVSVCCKAIQELQKEIEDLKKEMNK